MSTHTIFDELSQLANKLGISASGCHNIKDILRKMNQENGGNSNAQAIADAIKNMKFTLPYPIVDGLSALAIANVTLDKVFSENTYSYLGTVADAKDSGALTITAAQGTTVTATFNGETVASGDTLTFHETSNVLVVTVSADDVAPITYTITFPFWKVAADLTALAITNVTLEPTFAAGVYDYVGTLAEGEVGGELTITPATGNEATASFNGETVETGDDIVFEEGENTLVVAVDREDALTKTYTVTVTVEG